MDGTGEEPIWTYGDLALFIALSIPCAFIGMGIAALFLNYGPWRFEAKGVRILMPQFLAYAMMLAPLSLVIGKYQRPVWRTLGWKLRPGQILPAIAAGVVAAVLVLALGVLLQTPDNETPMHELLKDPVSIALVSILAVSLGPLFEEMFFRGLLQPLLIRSSGVVPGILLASLPFALLHGGQYGWSWRHLLLILIAGSSFGWMRQRTGSTAYSTLMHGAYNLVLVVGYLLGRETK